MMIVFAKNKRQYCRLKAGFWAFCGKKKKKGGFNRRLDAFFSGGQSPPVNVLGIFKAQG
tara:strand:+ start:55 stop:231 length:177 start_codon:yes stop_codon:yes gene_type:complete